MVAMELTSLNYFYESCFMDLLGEDICPHHFPQNRFQLIPNRVSDKFYLLFLLITGEDRAPQTYSLFRFLH